MTFNSLLSAPPSGRSRPVIIEDTDYSTAVIRQGSAIPWTDLAALAGHFGQVHSLLGSDLAWIDVQRWQRAHLSSADAIVESMSERSRTGYALRTLLRHEGLLDEFTTMVTTVADAARSRVVLRLPSPGTWLQWAHDVAGTPIAAVDDNAADSASMYVAEWLGRLGALPVDLVLLDALDSPTDLVEKLGDYTAIANVTAHLGWSVALRDRDGIAMSEAHHVAILDSDFWEISRDIPPAGDALLTTIPASAGPETVLEKLALLR